MSSAEEARKIAEQDPTVVERRNTVDVFSWTGPAGIGVEHKRLHTADPNMPQDMGVHPFCLLSLNRDLPGRDPLLQQHANYIAGLRKNGKLAAAGPSSGYGDVVETLIFSRIPDTEARQLLDADPAVKAGLLKPEFHRWWSAAHVLP